MQTTTQPSHEDLEKWVLQAQAGDSAAFGRLYDSLYDKLYGYAYRRSFDKSASEDIIANSFYDILTHLHSFKWQDGTRFYAWVFRIVMNEIATHYRKSGQYVLREDWLELADIARDDPTLLEEAVTTERDLALHEAVGELPEKFRSVVELYYFAGLSHIEIARTLGIREGAARVRLHRAIALLQTKMQGDEYAYRG